MSIGAVAMLDKGQDVKKRAQCAAVSWDQGLAMVDLEFTRSSAAVFALRFTVPIEKPKSCNSSTDSEFTTIDPQTPITGKSEADPVPETTVKQCCAE